jgi:hypothetical protein
MHIKPIYSGILFHSRGSSMVLRVLNGSYDVLRTSLALHRNRNLSMCVFFVFRGHVRVAPRDRYLNIDRVAVQSSERIAGRTLFSGNRTSFQTHDARKESSNNTNI